jgi:cysteine desulfurase
MAVGCDREVAQGSLRFSFGQENNEEDVDYAVAEFAKSVEFLRKLAPRA